MAIATCAIGDRVKLSKLLTELSVMATITRWSLAKEPDSLVVTLATVLSRVLLNQPESESSDQRPLFLLYFSPLHLTDTR